MRKFLLLAASHALVGLAGFALGVYLLPVLIAPEAPSAADVAAAAQETAFKGEFWRDLIDSDPLHWGEGTVTVGSKAIARQFITAARYR
jgi:hypothetical protein